MKSIAQSIPGSEDDLTSDQQPKSKRAKKPNVQITPAQEQEVADWVGDNTILYDKSRRDYKNTTLRDKLWADKAAEMDVPRDVLYSWYLSMRTRYGKLYKSDTSGAAAREYTEREKWIMEAFGYLGKHIVRNKPKTAGLKLSNLAPDELPEMVFDSESTDVQQTTQLPKRSKESRKQEDDDVLAQLTQRAADSLTMQKLIESQMSQASKPETVRDKFAAWQAAKFADINDSLWEEFEFEAINLVRCYVLRSKSLGQQQSHFQQQQQTFQQQYASQQQQPQYHQMQPPAEARSSSAPLVPSVWSGCGTSQDKRDAISTPPPTTTARSSLNLSGFSDLIQGLNNEPIA